jgi:hypothetical protein
MHNIFIETIPFLQQHTTHTVPHKAFCVKKIICRRRKKKSKNTFYFFYTKRSMGHSSGGRSGRPRPLNQRRVLAVFLNKAQHSIGKQLAGNNCCRITSSIEKYDFFLLLLYFTFFVRGQGAWPTTTTPEGNLETGPKAFAGLRNTVQLLQSFPETTLSKEKTKTKTKELKYDF